jgi:hypothetical protein
MTDEPYDNLIVNNKIRAKGEAHRLTNMQLIAGIQPGNAGGGKGYQSAPSVTFSGGGCSYTASATATVSNGTIMGINVTYGGAGYTSAPYVTIAGPGSGASLSASINNGQVTAVNIGNQGSGYTYNPVITFSGDGHGAKASADIQGSVAFVSVLDGGFGYTTAPTVVFSSGTAQATASISGIGRIIVKKGGSGYTSAPTISFTGGGGSGASAIALVMYGQVIDIIVTDPGSNYTSDPTVNFSGGGGSNAEATAKASIGCITKIVVTNGGSGYSSEPDVTFSGGGGQEAYAQATITGYIIATHIIDGGSGYSSAPAVTVSGQPATAKAFLNTDGTVAGVLLTSVIPRGTNGIKTQDNIMGNYLDVFSVTEAYDNAPLLVTNQGFIVKKDIQAGGFVASQQGAIMLNHGLFGRPILSSPPGIMLIDSDIEYPSGSTVPNNPEYGQIFNQNGTFKMWNGTNWFTGSFTGKYDTLFLLKADCATPAHLNLGNLTFGATNAIAKMVLGGSDYGYYDQSSNWHYYDNLFLVKANGTTPAHLNLGSLYAQHVYARGSETDISAHFWSMGENNFHLTTGTNDSATWKIGYGDGTGAFDTAHTYLASEGTTISVVNGDFKVGSTFKVKANDYWDVNGTAYATFHGFLTGTATNATYATSAGSASSASAIPTYSGSDPSSPPSGSIWLRTDL